MTVIILAHSSGRSLQTESALEDFIGILDADYEVFSQAPRPSTNGCMPRVPRTMSAACCCALTPLL